MMKLVLFDTDIVLCQEWIRAFASYDDRVSVRHSDLRELYELEHIDGLVSPANSFGLMDGGVDQAISDLFPTIQWKVQRMIEHEWDGYLPVGTARVVPTGDPKCRSLVVAPTMPWPMRVGAFNVYNVMRSVLSAVRRVNDSDFQPSIDVLACPGLATGTGGVSQQAAAAAMQAAWIHHNTRNKPPESWMESVEIRADIDRALSGVIK
jgi:O-acetyl-ADP-ribose deacetylase (regulator of RNase III)